MYWQEISNERYLLAIQLQSNLYKKHPPIHFLVAAA